MRAPILSSPGVLIQKQWDAEMVFQRAPPVRQCSPLFRAMPSVQESQPTTPPAYLSLFGLNVLKMSNPYHHDDQKAAETKLGAVMASYACQPVTM